MLIKDLQLSSRHLAHLPLIRALVKKLGIDDAVDELLPKDPRSRVSDADCVAAMIVNILSGRCALYSMPTLLEHVDTDVVFGTDCPADAFNDSRLAATLDHIFEAGTDNVLGRVVSSFLRPSANGKAYSVALDTTSIALKGAYDCETVDGAPVPKQGFSKDHRSELKQLVFGMSLHGAVGTPLTCSMLDGNTADKGANRWTVEQLAEQLPDEDDVTVVGDSKLVDAELFGQLIDEGFHFVSLVAKTYNVRAEIIEQVRIIGEPLPELARSKGRLKSDPDKLYRGASVKRPMRVIHPRTGEVTTPDMTLLVVHSDGQRTKFDNALNKRLVREERAFMADVKKANKRGIRCPEDAESARDHALKILKWQDTSMSIEAVEIAEKRPGPGRPKKGDKPPSHTEYRLVYEQLSRADKVIAKAKFHASHFVLVTDRMDWSDERILMEYRNQSAIEGHGGFRWLKNVALVAPVFLKTPSRIAALGLVFMLALMVRNYLQFELRRQLEATDQTVGGRKKNTRTNKPTTETALLHFMGVSSVRASADDRIVQRSVDALSADAKVILELLRVHPDIFTRPFEKWPPLERATC